MAKSYKQTLPWMAIALLYFAGIAMMWDISSTLEGDLYKVGAIAMMAVLAGGMLHGMGQMANIVRVTGQALKPPHDDKTPPV